MELIIEELGFYIQGWEKTIERVDEQLARHEESIRFANEAIQRSLTEKHRCLDAIDQAYGAIEVLRDRQDRL